jgi:membrane fusion protein, multidrug efflux system
VRPDRTVGIRQVGVGVTDGDDVSIEQGLQVGEQVVVEGAERLRDGAAIAPRNGP